MNEAWTPINMALCNGYKLEKGKLGLIETVNSKIVPKIIIEKGSLQIYHVADHNLRRTGFLSVINTQD